MSIDDDPERVLPPLEEAPPKIEFPCLYPIKVIGYAVDTFRAQVLEAIERHTGAIDPNLIH